MHQKSTKFDKIPKTWRLFISMYRQRLINPQELVVIVVVMIEVEIAITM